MMIRAIAMPAAHRRRTIRACWSYPDGPPELRRGRGRFGALPAAAAAWRPRCSCRWPRSGVLAIVKERQKPRLLCRTCEGPQYDCSPGLLDSSRPSCNFSLIVPVPASVAQERGSRAANAGAGGVAATPFYRAPTRSRHGRRTGAPGAGANPDRRTRRASARIASGRGETRRSPRRPSALLLGRYRLIDRLGAGGFGVVWRAHDELLQRDVAVKRIWLGPDGDSERAAREAHATARLSHPAIVALYEACPLGEAFYLISELVPGCTLGDLIRSDGARRRAHAAHRPRPRRRARARPRARRDPPRHQAAERARPGR